MQKSHLLAGVLFLSCAASAAPISRADPLRAQPLEPTAPAAQRSLCGPARHGLLPADCSFVVDELAMLRELTLRRNGPFDSRADRRPAPRWFGIPEPVLFSAAGIGLFVLGAARRPRRRTPVRQSPDRRGTNCASRAA